MFVDNIKNETYLHYVISEQLTRAQADWISEGEKHNYCYVSVSIKFIGNRISSSISQLTGE